MTKKPLDGRSGRPETQPGQDRRNAAGPPAGPFALEEPGHLRNEIRKLVDRRPGADQVADPAFDIGEPVENGLRRDDEGAGRGLDRHAMAGSVGEDRQAVLRPEVRPPMRVDLSEAPAQEFVLGAELIEALVQMVDLGGQRSSTTNAGTPGIVGLTDPAGDEQDGF